MDDLPSSSMSSPSNVINLSGQKRRFIDKFLGIKDCLKQVICNSEDIREQSRISCYNRFAEIYEEILRKNLSRAGLDMEEKEVMTYEFEPVDVAKEKFFQQELIPKQDDVIVEMVKKRKTCPKIIKKNVMKYREALVNHFSRLRVEVPRKDTSSVISCDITKAVDTIKESSQIISDINKCIMRDEAVLLRTCAVREIQERVKHRQNTLLNASLVRVEASATPLKRKLKDLDNTFHMPDKRLKFSQSLTAAYKTVHRIKSK